MDTPTAIDLAAADRFRPAFETDEQENGETWRYGLDSARNFYCWEHGMWESLYCEDVPAAVQTRLFEMERAEAAR